MCQRLITLALRAQVEIFTAIETLTVPWSAYLVALSGCETGRGKVFSGEGTVGLVHSLLATGVPRVLASQWKVDEGLFKLGVDGSRRPVLVEDTSQWNFYPGLVLFSQLCQPACEDAPSDEEPVGCHC